ncbi:hypothetical protein RMR16_002750 [Agrobacterium sp. rho-13.3]|uniref:hypothetical protein n=1 Tax=Agrobacterium sp. rho-13.3 TaxID=3072980 RepID=UPI002A0CB91B|nr:hypothetical protein [Agrobacterium sp. rho-13.3]MDX8308725.1 hypothetical protein [Agrobacterium sp. rho-13.3]
MAMQSAEVVDLKAYRDQRKRSQSPVEVKAVSPQPFIMWMPVWAYVPVAARSWNYGAFSL